MKVCLVLNTYNEGPDVGWTIDSARRHRGDCELDVVVVADGTTDGSCENLGDDVLVLKPEKKIGIGKAKSVGVKHALDPGADVIAHLDAHNRISRGTMADWGRACLEHSPCIITPPVGPLSCKHGDKCKRHGTKSCNLLCPDYADSEGVPNNSYCGGHILAFDRHDHRKVGLFCDNTIEWPSETLTQTQAVNPSSFAYSRETFDRLGGWNRYPGWWGSQELGISLRAWFSDTPIYVYRDVCVLHRYRSWNHPQGKALSPYEIPDGHRTANWMYAHRVVFDEKTWNAIWQPWFRRWHGDRKAEEIFAQSEAEAQHREFAERKVRSDAEFFAEVLRRPFPADWHVAEGAQRALYCIGGGLGNVLMCVPTIKALSELSGEPVDVWDRGLEQADDVKEVLELQPWVRKVVKDEPDLAYYRYVAGSYWARGPVFTPIESRVAEVDRAWRTQHEVECNFRAAKAVGYKGPMPSGQLTTWPQVSANLSTGYVVAGIGCAGFVSKSWPHWAECCKRLKAADVPLVFLGTAKDDQPWMSLYGENLCGKTTIAQAAGILWAARYYIGIDNGLSHLAAAVRTPVLALYGPSSERKNRPWTTDCRILRADEYDCAPCWDHPRADKCRYEKQDQRPCMVALSPEYVADQLLSLLNSPAWESGDAVSLYLSRKQQTENIGGEFQQFHAEFAQLVGLLRDKQVRRVIEIGCANGTWILTLAGALNRRMEILLIDPHPAPQWYVARPDKAAYMSREKAVFERAVNELTARGHIVRFVNKRSDDALLDARKWAEGGLADVLHIDGDHDGLQPLTDYTNYVPLVRSGGFVILHDIFSPGHKSPGILLDSLRANRDNQVWTISAPGDPARIRVSHLGIGVIKLPGRDGA